MGRAVAVLFAVTLLGCCVLAQGQPAAQPQAPAASAAPAQDDLKNIQVLKGMSHDDVLQSMQYFSQSLGVECDFCHVGRDANGQQHFDADDKREKKTARQMLTMVKSINDQFFDGRQQVTCASCHAGREQPRAFPPIADLDTLKARIAAQQAQRQRQQQMAQAQQPPAPGQPQSQGQQPGQRPQGGPPNNGPAPAELFAKYETAIGGADALAKLTTLSSKYTTTNAVNGNTSSGEVLRKAPDKVLSTVSFGPDRSQTIGYDGTTAWSKGPRGVQPVTGPNLDQAKFVANFWRDLKLSDRYSRSRTFGKDKVNGHDVYVVRGTVKDSRQQEQLFFDVDSGLLLRRITFRPTPQGPLPDQVDFEDYRDVGGVKVPFVLKTATPDNISTRTYTDFKFNVPVEDSKFAMPAGQ
jgi:photosynthetic reaction center cytochrome c subunit